MVKMSSWIFSWILTLAWYVSQQITSPSANSRRDFPDSFSISMNGGSILSSPPPHYELLF